MPGFDVLVQTRLTETVDGLPVLVQRGRCRAQATHGGMSLRSHDETGQSHSIIIAKERFERHLVAGAIVIVDAAQICTALDA
jgi:hypothetical protein